jgi:hypothetical protein
MHFLAPICSNCRIMRRSLAEPLNSNPEFVFFCDLVRDWGNNGYERLNGWKSDTEWEVVAVCSSWESTQGPLINMKLWWPQSQHQSVLQTFKIWVRTVTFPFFVKLTMTKAEVKGLTVMTDWYYHKYPCILNLSISAGAIATTEKMAITPIQRSDRKRPPIQS